MFDWLLNTTLIKIRPLELQDWFKAKFSEAITFNLTYKHSKVGKSLVLQNRSSTKIKAYEYKVFVICSL